METENAINIYTEFLEELNKFCYFRELATHYELFEFANEDWQKIVDDIDYLELKGVISIQPANADNKLCEYGDLIENFNDGAKLSKYFCEMVGTANINKSLNV